MSNSTSVRILVVESNPTTLQDTAHVLRSVGWSVLEAATGAAAMSHAADGVDLILLDVNLPDTNGFEICRQLRLLERTARTPLVHIYASAVDDAAKVHGLEVGADAYLTHPVEPPVLIATVNAFLRTRHAEEALRRSEAKLRAVFEQAPSGIAIFSPQWTFLEINPTMGRLLRIPPEQILGRSLREFISAHEDDGCGTFESALDTHGTWRGVCPLHRPDGELIHLDWSISVHSAAGLRLAVVTDISDRIRNEQEREDLLASEQAARAEAERANRLKDEFLATLSHELRTPLNAIVGWSQLLRLGRSDPAELAEGLEAIERSAKAQSQLIADLLDVSRITSGKLRLELHPLDPVSLVEAALAAVMPAAAAKSIRIDKQLEGNVGPISGDSSRLQQVIWNLLNNAVKFTPRGGRIEVTLRRASGQAEITISDTGTGIKPELLPHLFERFRQGDASTTRDHGGLGLGLAIAKHLTEMHGGTIGAHSDGEGQGSTFTVRLPITAVQMSATAEAAGTHPALARLDGVRVLVVEDDADARWLIQRVLAEAGAEVAATPSVQEALATIESERPHLMISDIGMPGEDGYDLIRKIRAQGYSADVLPAIALTAFARVEDRERSLQAGYQVHVNKPVDPIELTTTVARVIRQAARPPARVNPARQFGGL
jgi:PAS domain S-box-containing protein